MQPKTHLFSTPNVYVLCLADSYNIYDECGQDDRRRTSESPRYTLQEARERMSAPSVVVETADSFSVAAGYQQALNGYQCG